MRKKSEVSLSHLLSTLTAVFQHFLPPLSLQSLIGYLHIFDSLLQRVYQTLKGPKESLNAIMSLSLS